MHTLAFAMTMALLVAGSWRLAGRAATTLSARVLVTAVVAGSFVVLTSLLLGLVGLAGHPAVLAAVTVVAAALVWWRVTPNTEASLTAWWRRLDPPHRASAGALLGLLVVWLVWVLQHPVVGSDAMTYHLSEALHWVKHGNAGATVAVNPYLPYGSYPLVDEIILAWNLALAGGFGPLMAWTLVSAALLAIAGWTGLRALGAHPLPAGLAVAALLSGPMIVGALPGPSTDLSATMWLAVAATLVILARSQPGLTIPGLLAIGLAVGTKTTVVLYGGALLGLWLVTSPRAWIRDHRVMVAGAVVAAAVIGGFWYFRDLLVHGSPVYPTVSTPWGDPRPLAAPGQNATFAGHVAASLHGRQWTYLDVLAGHLAVLVAAVAVVLSSRRRLATALAAAGVLGAVAWAVAPTTGIPAHAAPAVAQANLGAVRYALPAIVCACAALALAGSGRGRILPWVWRAVLAASIVWSVVECFNIQVRYFRPDLTTLVSGVALGIALVLVVPALRQPRRRVRRRRRRPWRLATAVWAVGWLALGSVVGSYGFLRRHAATAQVDAPISDMVARYDSSLGNRPMAMTPVTYALLTGDHLRRDIQLIGPEESCPQIHRRFANQTIVITPGFGSPAAERLRLHVATCLASVVPIFNKEGYLMYYNFATLGHT